MASVRRRNNSPYYYACYRDQHGHKRQATTRETNRNRALRLAISLEEACRKHESREALLAQYNRISEDLFGKPLRVDTPRAYMNEVIGQRQGEIAESSVRRYRQVVDEFLEFLGPDADAPFRDVSYDQLIKFRAAVAERTSAANANAYVKCLRGFFSRAVDDLVIFDDPSKRIRSLVEEKRPAAARRRPFTTDELHKLLDTADVEWRGMITIAILTGQRLGDIAAMHWSDLKIHGGTCVWAFRTEKTDREMSLPLPNAVVEKLVVDLKSGKIGADARVFPCAFAHYGAAKRSNTLSNQFHAIMSKAGIVAARDHKGGKEGRSAARAASQLGFHSLRHTVTSVMSAAGVPRAVVMDLVGHDSPEMSQVYTHTELSQKAAAQEKLLKLLQP